MTKFTAKRGFILACAAICCSFTGAIYMWSIFNQPLIDTYGWKVQQVSFAYSLFLIVGCFSGFAGGWLQQRFKTTTLLLIAGLMDSLGWFLAGFSTTIPMLYFTFGIIGGLGDGLLYNVSVSVATKWFPDKRGFANGVCVGAVGMSALVFAPLGNAFIELFSAADSFKLCGLIFMVFFIVFARYAQAPPPGWVPEGWSASDLEKGNAATEKDYSGSQTLRQPTFWVLFTVFVAATTTGTMLTSHTSGIGQSLVGMTPAQGALMIGVLSIGGTLGRFGFGTLSDKIGRYSTLTIMLSITGVIMLFFLGNVTTFPGLMLALAVGGACFGGFMTVMPSLCADLFGNRYFGQNYSFLYAGYTAGAFVGPMLAANILDRTGMYNQAFTMAGLLAIAAIALVYVVKFLASRR